MRIDLASIPNQFLIGCQRAYAQVCQWADYSVTLINRASPYLQNPFPAGVVLVGLNIAFFEIIVLICYLINKILNQIVPFEALSMNDRNIRALGLGGVFVATLAVANWMFCRILRLPLAYWKIAAISFSTNFCYLILKTR